MKVLLIADLLIRNHDGCNRTLFQILDKIDKYNIDLKIICGDHTELPLDVEILKVPSITIPFNKDYKAAFPYHIGQKIEDLILDFNPDVIHITSPSLLGFFVQKIAIKYQIKTTTIYHTNFLSYFSYYFKNNNTLIKKIKQTLEQKYIQFYKNFDIVFSPTNLMKSHLLELGLKTENIRIWGRGIDKDIFNIDVKVENLSQKLFKNNDPILLFANRLVWEKNLETLSNLYHFLLKKDLKYNFLIIGDGTAREELEQLMPKAKFLKNVTQKELSVYYASSDLFIFPSDTETFGNVLLEAMCCGLPIVAADGGSNADLVRNYVDGLIVPTNDLKAYEAAISIILLNKNYFSTNALRNPKLLKWDDVVDNFIDQLTEEVKPITEKVAI
jgi:glycosyltransferase involved in cell wall biosynthesis